MTDRTLRGIAREAHLGPDQEAYLFHLKLRSGQIAGSQLELLAHLGDERALLALGREACGAPLSEWISALSRWGRTPCARALLVIAARSLLTIGRGRCDRSVHAQSACHSGWVARLQAWVDCPCASIARREVESADRGPCSFSSLLLVRGRRQIGRETARVARHLLDASGRRQSWLKTLIQADLIRWAGSDPSRGVS